MPARRKQPDPEPAKPAEEVMSDGAQGVEWPEPQPVPEVEPSEPWGRELFPRQHLSAALEAAFDKDEEAGGAA